jgi:OTU domain-containing protein 6
LLKSPVADDKVATNFKNSAEYDEFSLILRIFLGKLKMIPDEDLERQKMEKKEIGIKVLALKKSIKGSSASKQQKAAVLKEIEALENGLKQRHQRELEQCDVMTQEVADAVIPDTAQGPEASTIVESLEKVHISKGKKRKNKKMELLEQMQKEAKEEVQTMPNLKAIENEGIEKLAKEMDKKVVQVPADGHCLYYSISRQLELVNNAIGYIQLRSKTAQYLREHKHDFIHFLVNENQDVMTEEEYEKYCDECEFGASWGGQIEVL